MVISYVMQRRRSRGSKQCRGYCTDYPRAVMSGTMIIDGKRVSFYNGLNGRYCAKCDYPYLPESWKNFQEPSRCPCCGYKMRIRSKHNKLTIDFKDFKRYE